MGSMCIHHPVTVQDAPLCRGPSRVNGADGSGSYGRLQQTRLVFENARTDLLKLAEHDRSIGPNLTVRRHGFIAVTNQCLVVSPTSKQCITCMLELRLSTVTEQTGSSAKPISPTLSQP
jgi:hypothetical protein